MTPDTPSPAGPDGWQLVLAERERQIAQEGWTPEHDDRHDGGELLRAGVLYFLRGKYGPDFLTYDDDGSPIGWPWEPEWWKPKDRQRDLVRAGALCLAEEARINRVRGLAEGAHYPPARHKLALILEALAAAPQPPAMGEPVALAALKRIRAAAFQGILTPDLCANITMDAIAQVERQPPAPEAKAEPVAWRYQQRLGDNTWFIYADDPESEFAQEGEPLYLAPPADDRRKALTGAAEPAIYIASKTRHADRWRTLRDRVGEPIISSWINEAGEGETSDWTDLWDRCASEASRAAVTIVYHEGDDVLKGALVEAGAALASGRAVFVVGDPPGSWVHHRNVRRFPSMKEAIAASRELIAALILAKQEDRQHG